MPGSSIELDAVNKSYALDDGERLLAADGLELRVGAGELVAVTGPSGSGKSTLLHLIAGIDSPDTGTIRVDEREVSALRGARLADHRRHVGIVFQRFNLLPALTVRDNVLAPVIPFGIGRDIAARADDLLDAVGLTHRSDALPSKLSGGQQQRVAIARALIWEPGLLLADEPTGNLDTHTGADVLSLLADLRTAHGTTMLIATHDPAVAATCHRLLRLQDGRISDDHDITDPEVDVVEILARRA